MNQILIDLFGQGKDLNCLQMSCRGVVVFVFALILIRISGRRSFGIRTALDNIIVIMLGAILSRAVTGASDFFPVIVCSLVIVLLHRGVAWMIVKSKRFSRFIEGDKILLMEEGLFKKREMEKGLVCQEDIMQGIRKSALTDNLEDIEKVYMERNGEISPIKKKRS